MHHNRAIVRFLLLPLGASVALAAGGCSTPAATYSTPEAAVDALVSSLESKDRAGLTKVLGAQGVELLDSGDAVADSARVADFLSAYRERHSLVPAGADEMALVIGPSDWLMPVPLRRDAAGWQFDIAAGEEEVLTRRIGRNELSVIEVMRAIHDAEREYATGVGGGAYAQRIVSTAGAHDGLYWSTGAGEAPSPLGPLVADAAAEGYTFGGGNGPRSYHGYRYRILTSQGSNAPGGAMDYVRDGRMTGGFAVIAWPVQYGNSGITTFLVSRHGVVYEADLGSGTDRAVASITTFDPDARWSLARP